jgi:hypothetical protein
MLEFLLKVSYSHDYVFTQAIEVGHDMPWGKFFFFHKIRCLIIANAF